MKYLSVFQRLFSLVSILACCLGSLHSQVLETKNWCLSRCDVAGDELKNTALMHLRLENDSLRNLHPSESVLRFPLRIAIVQSDSVSIGIEELKIRKVIGQLNESFSEAGFSFFIEKVVVIVSPLHLEDLSGDNYGVYNAFSDKYDEKELISLYVFEHGLDFCQIEGWGISCSRTGGFSYVLSERTNNLVISRFDVGDIKVLAHEFGHFFGLYHTFEEMQFGKDDFDPKNCATKGDRICDTPPDPGDFFETYVSYSDCEMFYFHDENGHAYKPSVTNFMSYYKPCYLRKFDFSPGQIDLLRLAGHSELRKKFSR